MIELTRDELSRCQIGTLNIKLDIEDILHDQNDINESTRAQLAAINDALTELQSLKSQNATSKPRKPIGFIQPEDDDDKK